VRVLSTLSPVYGDSVIVMLMTMKPDWGRREALILDILNVSVRSWIEVEKGTKC